MNPAKISTLDMRTIESLIGMGSGYVLDFNNRTFSDFFRDLGVDIDAEEYQGSKASRLRDFLRRAEPDVLVRVLELLLEHRGARSGDANSPDVGRYKGIIERLRAAQTTVPMAIPRTNIISLDYVAELESKTDARLVEGDLDGAITTARTMLEALLQELERQLTGGNEQHRGDLQRLYKLVAQKMNITEERVGLDENFKQVIRGLIQIVNGLSAIRNTMSDGHPRVSQPAPHHARVSVNAAKTVGRFLVESFLFQREQGRLPLQGGQAQ